MALRDRWAGETHVLPCVTLESVVEGARVGYLEAREMAERMRFSAWVNTLRDLAERQDSEIEAATRRWMEVIG
jgi:hypothetical protein